MSKEEKQDAGEALKLPDTASSSRGVSVSVGAFSVKSDEKSEYSEKRDAKLRASRASSGGEGASVGAFSVKSDEKSEHSEKRDAKLRAARASFGSEVPSVGAFSVGSDEKSPQSEKRAAKLRATAPASPGLTSGSKAASVGAFSVKSDEKSEYSEKRDSKLRAARASSGGEVGASVGAVSVNSGENSARSDRAAAKLRLSPAVHSPRNSSNAEQKARSVKENAKGMDHIKGPGVFDAKQDMAVSKKEIGAGIPIEETPVEAIAVDDIEADAAREVEQLRREMEEERRAIPIAVVSQDNDSSKPPWCKGVAVFVVFAVIAVVIVLTVGKSDDSTALPLEPIEDNIINTTTTQPTTSANPTAAPTAGFTLSRFNTNFNRISTFPVCLQLDPTCNTDTETIAEIVKASDDGMMLVYTDAKQASIGLVNITDPTNPRPAGLVNVGGGATSVIFKGNYIVVAVDTSPNFTNPSGNIQVMDVDTLMIAATIDMGGQPDSIDLSPDGKYIAVAIENTRDEDFNDGSLPQAPAGFLQVVDCSAEDPTYWTTTKVEMDNLEGILYKSDPEPEFVAINTDNIAVVTLQENNGIALVDLTNATVLASFSAGFASLSEVDTAEEDVIEQTGSIPGELREPDGVTWIGTDYFATADEGDLEKGGRGFTIYDTSGAVVYTSGNMLDELAIRFGHYPDNRSGNRGNEPENILYAKFESLQLLFVVSERANLVFVFEVSDLTNPIFRQVLPTAIMPEGIVAIPSRNLLAAASHDDNRSKNFRSAISIYEISESAAVYPHLFSANGHDGNPIPLSALSGLSWKDGMLYTVEDKTYKNNRMLAIDPSTYPYTVTTEILITDVNNVLGSILDETGGNKNKVLNVDLTVNLDLEGIEAIDGGFWLAHDGSPNLLLKVDTNGIITEGVTLPTAVSNFGKGSAGVAVEGDNVVVCFEEAWAALGDPEPRLGIYNTASNEWKFVFYPLDAPESQNGGSVGLSDIASLGNGAFLVLERDNQGATDAAIKKIYKIELGDFSIADGETITKTFVHDLIPDLLSTGGLVPEKVEGLTVDDAGNVWVNNDNEGVKNNSGEQMLINLGPLN